MSVTALIVDDSAAARQMTAYNLRQAGCRVVGEAANAADALKLFRELKPDIVCLDLMMPVKEEIDSLEFVREIKKEAPQVAVIVASVISFDTVRQSFADEGIFAYVVKPFSDFAMNRIRLKLKRTFPELAAVK